MCGNMETPHAFVVVSLVAVTGFSQKLDLVHQSTEAMS